jgi:hypothetical protein
MTITQETKPSLWDQKFIIDNLPSWIYSDNHQPESIEECKAKISAIEYTIRDIDLQIEIRELELKTGSSRHSSSFEFDRWKAQALRAKQTHMYLLNAYTYWLLLSERQSNSMPDKKLNDLINILIEDPVDIVAQLEELL